jgi:NADP-dependent 3-hydroxy acid dehydrogenase YdfG
MNRIILITGATSGIGKACAEKFSALGDNVIINGRRVERLEELETRLREKYNNKVLPLCFDVQDKETVFNTLTNLPLEWRKIDVLVNNSGLALGRDSFENADLQDWDTMFDTNVKGLTYVTKAILPYMITAKKGHIINMCSIAGKEVYESGNGYCASKFAVDALNKAMRIDLLKYNIKVTGIYPGAVETEFSLVRFKGEKDKAVAAYTGLVPLQAEDIANTIVYCSNLPSHVCINEMVIMPTQQAGSYYFHRNQ